MRKFISPYYDDNGPVAYAVADETGEIVCKTNSYAVACQSLTDDDVFIYDMEVLDKKINAPGAIQT